KYGVQNASILLVHRESREILACLGSVDFFNREIQGQVNGTTAKRSPGSTLKPFIYALSMDQGLIHPLTMVKDSPTRFGPYNPENFDGDFNGPITVKDALIKSRNVPAIRIANRLKDPDLYDFLKNGGIKDMLSRGHYGLALVLGGGEVSMVEMVRLYTMLGDGGVLKPLESILEHDNSDLKKDSEKRLLSPESSFMTLEILKDNPRPNQDFRKQSGLNSLPVYWKTGTSIAFRDAWSIGLFGPYAIVVWIGNFDARGNPSFVGRAMAAPLMFEIIDSIKAKKRLSEPMDQRGTDGRNLTKMKFCAVSGRLPTALCPNTVTGWYIPGKSRSIGVRSTGKYSSIGIRATEAADGIPKTSARRSLSPSPCSGQKAVKKLKKKGCLDNIFRAGFDNLLGKNAYHDSGFQ
ncbi:MAG TPA: hypothetical protein ENI73_04540, partial [Spirochaetes bacterium]|nr:hypothetical protein [Spirochaetota bacterium]